MKKTLLATAIFATSLLFLSCSDDKNDDVRIEFESTPTAVQDFFKTHFTGTNPNFDKGEIAYIEQDKDGTYDVKFRNGVEIEFYSNGIWKEIDMENNALPESIAMLVPTSAIDYISTRYPNQAIEEIEKQGVYSDQQNIKIELRQPKVEVVFDYKGTVITDSGSQGGNTSENINDTNLLPQGIKSFLAKHFEGTPILTAKKDYKEYEVKLEGGYEVEFDLDGKFKSVEADGVKNVPESIFLDAGIVTNGAEILSYLKTNHSGQRIEDLSKIPSYYTGELKDGYIVELAGKPEYDVYFNSAGKFVKKVID